jgi:hypothetical protein
MKVFPLEREDSSRGIRRIQVVSPVERVTRRRSVVSLGTVGL